MLCLACNHINDEELESLFHFAVLVSCLCCILLRAFVTAADPDGSVSILPAVPCHRDDSETN